MPRLPLTERKTLFTFMTHIQVGGSKDTRMLYTRMKRNKRDLYTYEYAQLVKAGFFPADRPGLTKRLGDLVGMIPDLPPGTKKIVIAFQSKAKGGVGLACVTISLDKCRDFLRQLVKIELTNRATKTTLQTLG